MCHQYKQLHSPIVVNRYRSNERQFCDPILIAIISIFFGTITIRNSVNIKKKPMLAKHRCATLQLC